MRVHEAIAAALDDLGIDTMFGLIGDSNLFMVDRFVRAHGGRYISAVHESGAVMMAHGYAVRSGRLGVATVTQGPGLTNTATALVEATRSGTPLLLITGDTAPGNTVNPQSLVQEPFVRSTGADYLLLGSPDAAATAVREAVQKAMRQRQPVVLNCPTEYQWSEIEYLPSAGPASGAGTEPATDELVIDKTVIDETALDAALGVIAAARRPLILAGAGILAGSARAEVLRLAERIGAPIATTLRGRGLFSARDGCIGVFGTLSTDTGAEVIADADCVIAFGASLNAWTTARNGLLSGKSVVHIDANPDHIGRYAPVTAGVAGDAGTTASVLLDWIEQADVPSSPYREQVSSRLSDASIRWNASIADGYGIGAVISEIVNALPAETTITFDGGRFLGEAFKYAAALTPERQVLSTSFGAVGMGMGAALGAAAAAPEHPTLLITGDGGYMMSGMAEFQSAVRNDLPLIVLVCNDASYGAEYDQYVNKSLDPGLSLFEWPSFAVTAAAIGATGVTVEGEHDLPAALKALADPLAGSVLIDIRIDAAAIPEVPH
jgi:acetolactate synthase-1/2/3 large subunit